MGWRTIPPGLKRGPKDAKRQTESYNRNRGRQTYNRSYFEWYNASRRGIKFYNKFRQPYYTYRYREIWPQKTVQRTVPQFRSPNVYSRPSLGPLSQGALPPSGTPFGHKPHLSYEQQNKAWNIYKPWTQSLNKPPIPQFKEAQRRLEQTRSDYLYTTIPYSHMPPEIGDLAFVNTQRPRQPARRWPKWEPFTRPFLPDRPWPPDNAPDQPSTPDSPQRVNTENGCYEYSERLQTWIPCPKTLFKRKTTYRSSITRSSKISQRSISRNYHSFRNFNKLHTSKNTRYHRRRSRSYNRYQRYYNR